MNPVNPHVEINPAQIDSPPFFSYSGSLPAILAALRCTLAISTYQAGKLILVSSLDGEHIRLFGKNFPRPMGIAVNHSKLAIAGKYAVEVFANSKSLALKFPEKPGHYDSMFFPQATYHTGFADLHDLAWGDEGLWAVNTAFSCLVLMSESSHFAPKWQPRFITELTPEDRCHLNGLAMHEGKPAFVTLLGESDTKEGWRAFNHQKGQILDVATGKTLLENLPMPHSPRVHNDQLYFLLSAVGKVMKYDLASRSLEVLSETNSFIRGMDIYRNHIFVGTSTIRQSSRNFADLPVSAAQPKAGVKILDELTGTELAQLTFSDRVHETFDVKIIPDILRPTIYHPTDAQAMQGIMLPDGRSYWFRESKAQPIS